MFKAMVVAFCLLFAAGPAIADDGAKLVGVWKLISYEVEFKDGTPNRAIFGAHPPGYLIMTAEHRMAAVIEAEGRKPAKTDEERAALLQTLIAYSGAFRVEGNKWVTKVDVAWIPAWIGTEHSREYKLDGDKLEVISMWQPAVNLPGAPMSRGHLKWERVK